MSMDDKLNTLNRLRAQTLAGGGDKKVAEQRAKGKLTARERINLLADKDSFEEIDPFVTNRATEFGLEQQRHPGDAVVTGYAKVNDRPIFLYSQDFTVLGGSLSEVVAQKICKVMDLAVKNGSPIIGLIDSGGARIQEGAASLAGYGDIFLRNTLASGVVPQISVIMGPCAGGAVYSPGITDFIFMVKGTSQMYITGPDVVKAAIGEEVTHEALGGAVVHASKSGVAHFIADNDQECLADVRRLLSYLPQNNGQPPPAVSPADDPNRISEELLHLVPEDQAKAYDMKQVISRVADSGEFLEVHKRFAPNIIVGFARLNGSTVGIVGQQPSYMAGVIDINASIKGARFVRFCDCFNIPLITLVDVPGFMPGTAQEHGGIIKDGAKLIFAYAEATVPKIAVIIRKAYGGAYIVMSSKHLRGDINYVWPTGEIAVMGAEGAVNVIFRSRIAKSHDQEETRRQLIEEYRDKFNTPYEAAARGYVDDVIDPRSTRPKLIRALEMLENKEDSLPYKKHGNIPL